MNKKPFIKPKRQSEVVDVARIKKITAADIKVKAEVRGERDKIQSKEV